MRKHMPSLLQKFVSKWALNNSETAVRSLVKAYSYRICGSLTTVIISFIITGHFVVSLAIGATELLIKPFIYWCHERVWSRIRWGKL
jgi:uncharacterized membrane protein